MKATWHQDRFVYLDVLLQDLHVQATARVETLAFRVEAAYEEFDNWPLWKRILVESPRDTRLWTKIRWPVVSEFDEAIWQIDNLERLISRFNLLKGTASTIEFSAEEVRFLTKLSQNC
jgi:hypothetical protein